MNSRADSIVSLEKEGVYDADTGTSNGHADLDTASSGTDRNDLFRPDRPLHSPRSQKKPAGNPAAGVQSDLSESEPFLNNFGSIILKNSSNARRSLSSTSASLYFLLKQYATQSTS